MKASRARETSTLTPAIMKALRAIGAPALRMKADAYTGKGRSDLVIPLLCLEVKNASGTVSPAQNTWLRARRADGIPAYVVRSVAAAVKAVELTRRGYKPTMADTLELDMSFLNDLDKSTEAPAPAVSNDDTAGEGISLSLDDLVAEAVGDTPVAELPPADEVLAESDAEADALLAALGVEVTAPVDLSGLGVTSDTPQTVQGAPLIKEPDDPAGIDYAAVQEAQAKPMQTETVPAADLTPIDEAHALRNIADAVGAIGTAFVSLAGFLRTYAAQQDGKPALTDAPKRRGRKPANG